MDCPMDTSAPTFEMQAIEFIIQTSIPMAPTAATDLLPKRPTHAKSIKLYAICMKLMAISGIDSLTSWRNMFP